jgi:uncharacterized protein YwgA
MTDLKPLIGYIVDQVNDRGGVVGRTFLVKLVYLIDVEHYRRYRKQATGLKWRFHHYGPYAAELDTAISSLGLGISEHEFIRTVGDRVVSGYRYSKTGDGREIERAFDSRFDASVKRSVDKVIEHWALDSLWTIPDYVYFETGPMEGAKRGEYLDFSKVQMDPSAPRNTATLKLPEKSLSALRRRLGDRRKEIGKEVRKATEPAYDQVYAEACKVMEEEESRGPGVLPDIRLSGPDLE